MTQESPMLLENEQQLRAIFESTSIPVVLLDLQGQPIKRNPAFDSMFGVQGDDAMEDCFVGVTHPEDLATALKLFKELVAGKRDRYEVEKRYVNRHGQMTWGHLIASLVRDAAGQPQSVVSVIVDITDRKRAEEALRQSDRRFRAIFNETFEMIDLLGVDGRVIQINDAALAFEGASAEQIVGKYLWELPSWRDEETVERLQAAVARAAKGGFVRFELDSHDAQGAAIGVDFSVKPVRDEAGKVVMLLAEGRDITERKRLEREVLEISSVEQRRLGQDLHDVLGQNLTGIGFLSKVLQQKLEAAGRPEASAAAEITDLVTQAVSHARSLARGVCPVELEDLGLMTALRELAASTSSLFGVKCRFECAKPVVMRDNAIAMHLYYVAREACNNAIKHGKARNILIKLDDNHDRCCLSVKDDGIGVPDNIDKSPGMGLRIMNHRAATIGAALSVKRYSKGGTIVKCMLPNTNPRGNRHVRQK